MKTLAVMVTDAPVVHALHVPEYHRAQFQRLKARRGPKKAIIAVAASMLTAAYHMLHDGTAFQDLGP